MTVSRLACFDAANPDGMFVDWNPAVSCEEFAPVDAESTAHWHPNRYSSAWPNGIEPWLEYSKHWERQSTARSCFKSI
jgi:hypothetical protein